MMREHLLPFSRAKANEPPAGERSAEESLASRPATSAATTADGGRAAGLSTRGGEASSATADAPPTAFDSTPASPVRAPLSAAASAFDAIADDFDRRFGGWRSVHAQRTAVREILLAAFPPGSAVLEIGGGTGEDAAWLANRGRSVLMTDPSPRMVEIARAKLRDQPRASVRTLAAEEIHTMVQGRDARDEPGPSDGGGVHRAITGTALFDGAFSNFAGLNCVSDLSAVARGLAELIRPGGKLALVLFGPHPPGEVIVQLARGEPRSALRRLRRGPVEAKLAGRRFAVHYHSPREVRAAFAPGFRLSERRGIGIFVPPSAAEPWISGRPGLLRLLQRLDAFAGRPLALLGDHVLYLFERAERTERTPE